MLGGSTRRGWDSIWGPLVTRMDHANVEVLVDSRMTSRKGLRGLGRQQASPWPNHSKEFAVSPGWVAWRPRSLVQNSY